MGTHKGSNEDRVSAANGTDDREARSKFWIAAYTRPRSEKKAAENMAKDIETYVPIQTVVKQWSDRKKKIDVPVIPMVVFAHVEEDEVLAIKKNPLVLRILTTPGSKQPARIPDNQIERLKFMLKESNVPVNFETRLFHLEDKVRVMRGCLTGMKGSVERISEKKVRLIVSIDLLGGAIVELDSSDVEIYSD